MCILFILHIKLLIIIIALHSRRCIRPSPHMSNTLFSVDVPLKRCIPVRPSRLVSFFFNSVLLQVVFGLPLILRPSDVHPNDVISHNSRNLYILRLYMGPIYRPGDFSQALTQKRHYSLSSSTIYSVLSHRYIYFFASAI